MTQRTNARGIFWRCHWALVWEGRNHWDNSTWPELGWFGLVKSFYLSRLAVQCGGVEIHKTCVRAGRTLTEERTLWWGTVTKDGSGRIDFNAQLTGITIILLVMERTSFVVQFLELYFTQSKIHPFWYIFHGFWHIATAGITTPTVKMENSFRNFPSRPFVMNPSLTPSPWQLLICFSVPIAVAFPECHKWSFECSSFHLAHASEIIHAVCSSSSFLFEWDFIIWIYHTLFTHSPARRYLFSGKCK